MHELKDDRFVLYWHDIEKELLTIPHVWQPWWTLESIRNGVIAGHLQCWVVGTKSRIDAVLFTQIAIYPGAKMLQIIVAFGKLLDYIDLCDAVLTRYAETWGCSEIEMTGRPGWGPKLRKMGFKRNSIVMAKKLDQLRVN